MPLVDSSAIVRIEYNPEASILSVWFMPKGRRYDYFDVPAEVYQDFLGAESKGRFFNEHIREAYSFVRVTA